MRTALLFVALFGLVALASAQSYSYGGLKGTYYTDSACSTGSTSVTFTSVSAGSTTYPCISIGSGTGSSAIVANGYCYSYSISGASAQYWYVDAYGSSSTSTATCPSTGTGVPTGYSTAGIAYGTDFSTCEAFAGTFTGSFKPSGCSSASTLVVPSVLLVALAYVASKLSL